MEETIGTALEDFALALNRADIRIDNTTEMIGGVQVLINNERQHILLSGVIRPEDIQQDNSIASNLIADIRVAYSGTGVITDKQRPGWLGRIIDVVWPF